MYKTNRASHVVLVVKNPHAKAGDISNTGSIPGWGRSSGGGNGNPSNKDIYTIQHREMKPLFCNNFK